MVMIEQLQKILSTQGEEVSALLEILSTGEKEKLANYFDESRTQNEQNSLIDDTDIKIKFFALNALFIYIKNNPKIEAELVGKTFSIENLAYKIYELSVLIYQKDKTVENYFYLSSYAVLADKRTLLSNGEKKSFKITDALEANFLKFFISFCFSIDSTQDLEQRKRDLQELKTLFEKSQQAEEINSQQDLFSIVALSNLLSLAEKLQAYLLTGEGNNVSTDINNQTANAITVFFEASNREWEHICSLLRFVLQKHYQNSIWTVANTLPAFKEFVNQQIEQGSILLSLFPSQKIALTDILSSRKSTVLSMPTSSGKTLLAELKILYIRSLNQNNCLCAYIVPTNALVNQTLKRLKKSFANLKVEKLLAYNHFDSLEQELIGEKPDILISTPEKFNFLLKSQEHNFLDRLRLVVIDEAHNLSEPNRGSIWEFLLANLKGNDQNLAYLLLTPFINNHQALATWLGDENAVSQSIEWTPTKQYLAYHSLHNGKTQSKINYLPSARNSIIKEAVSIDLRINPQEIKEKISSDKTNDLVRNHILVKKYTKQKGCVLILHNGPDSAEKSASSLATSFDFSEHENKQKITYAKELIGLELGENHSLLDLLDKAIAFHHAKLPPLVKEIIEELVMDDCIKVLVATTTLAQGMNFPIKTVIFETLNLGSGATIKKLSYNDFWNIAGRAGRAYHNTEGHIVLGWKENNSKTKEKLERFIKEDIEETISSLKLFFDMIDENTQIDYQFIKDKPIAQNFLHYLNHLLNVSYQYNLDTIRQQDIINILSNSLYFKQNEFQEGFLETQGKVVNFSNQYINLIKEKRPQDLKLADTLGITDISLSTIIGISIENRPLLSESIEKNDRENLTQIIEYINSIPELKIGLGRQEGQFNAELVAGVLLSWINGKSIQEISHNNCISINECSGYIFSNLKNYIPWGMAIYQNISNDENPLLPSYAFYGVKDEQAVKLSYLGVPRFAVEKVKKCITDDSLYNDMAQLKKFLKNQEFLIVENIPNKEVVNKIIKSSLD
jgi:replicative superfamily II helicase